MRWTRLLCAHLLTFVIALGAFAINATACEGGGGGGGELTSLSTKLSGGGKEGEELTVSEGTKVKDKATLTGKNASKATGKVTYKVYSESACKTLAASAGEVTVSGESVPASSEEELEAGKAYYWQAHYGGDSKNAESTSPCTEILDVKAKTSLSTKLSGEGKEGEELTIDEGSKAKDTATLSGTNSSSAGGKLVYKVYSDKECKTLVKEAGEVTVSSGSVPASSEEELEGGKTYYWQATYKGDSLHEESKSACGSEVLNVKAKTTLTTTLSGEGKESATLTVVEGAMVKDKATLSGANSSTATGEVLYKVFSDNKCEHLVDEAGTRTVTSGAVSASAEEALEGAATYYWQASYGGDALHQPATSSCGAETLSVKAKTWLSTALTTATKSASTIKVPAGTSVTTTATLLGTSASTATGTVTYDIYSDDKCEHLVDEAGEVTVTGGSVPASSEETLATGTYYWRVAYSGDSAHEAWTSPCGDDIAYVAPSTSIATTLSDGESHSATLSVAEGTPVSDEASLSGENASTATGNVQYDVYAEGECKDLVADAGTASVTTGSVEGSTAVTLPPGVYYWQATYSGDENNAGSIGSCGEEVETVKGSTTVTGTLSSVSGSNPIIAVAEGASIDDDATIEGPAASNATGTVEYSVYSDSECAHLVASAGSASVTGGKAGASTEETLPAGKYYWRASYSGDSHNEASTGACGEEVSTVESALLTSTLSGEEETGENIEVEEGEPVTDTAKLSGAFAFMATGTVEYLIYSNPTCTHLVAEAGKYEVSGETFPSSAGETLSAGTYYPVAIYSGDIHNPGSSTLCGANRLVVKPGPAAKLEEVDFTGGQEVVLDHPINNTGGPLKPFMKVTEYPEAGESSVQWKSSDATNGPKNWPVVYVKGEKMTVEARFSPDALTKALVASKDLESVTITGKTSVFGDAISFSSKLNLAELEAQIGGATGLISTGAVSTPALPNEDGYSHATISWEWTAKIKGKGNVTESLGSSTHNLYVMYEKPRPSIEPMYFTVLDIASQDQVGTPRAPAKSETETIAAVWKGFTHKAVGPETPLETMIRVYDPGNGAITAFKALRYWPEGVKEPVGEKLSDLESHEPEQAEMGGTLKELLQRDKGECGTWAEALRAALGSEGIKTKSVPMRSGISTSLLAKRWKFTNAAPALNKRAQVTRERGVVGQAYENPWALFRDHAIALVENEEERAAKGLAVYVEFYDPSYGTGPWVAKAAVPAETIPKLEAAMLEYQKAALAGFCGMPASPLECIEAAAAPALIFDVAETLPGPNRIPGNGAYPAP